MFQLLSFNAVAEEFDSSLLGDENGTYKDIDLSVFSKPGGQLPGNYYIDIYLNDNLVDMRYIRFSDEDGNLTPCISNEMLESYGVSS
ncbi:TPA: FimD/PapC N-terminal domain-containing protein, partial [Escherichia coli]|nr:FimD/PapC N-terminal domain-containing protein [Escherichia coli]